MRFRLVEHRRAGDQVCKYRRMDNWESNGGFGIEAEESRRLLLIVSISSDRLFIIIIH